MPIAPRVMRDLIGYQINDDDDDDDWERVRRSISIKLIQFRFQQKKKKINITKIHFVAGPRPVYINIESPTRGFDFHGTVKRKCMPQIN